MVKKLLNLVILLVLQLECARQVAEKEEEIEVVQRQMENTIEEHQQQTERLKTEVNSVNWLKLVVKYINTFVTVTLALKHIYRLKVTFRFTLDIFCLCQIDSLQSQLDMLTSTKDCELDALHQELTCLNGKKQEDAQQIFRLREQLESAKQEKEEMQNSSDSEIMKLQKDLSALRDEKEISVVHFKQKVKALEEQIDSLKSSSDSDKVSFTEEARSLKEKLSKVTAESDLQLVSKNAQVQELENTVKELREQLQSNEDQCADLLASLATSQEQQAKIASELEAKITVLNQAEEQNQELESALVELKEQFLTAQSRWNDQIKVFEEDKEKHKSIEKEMYTERLSEVEKMLTATKDELLDVQKKLQDKTCWEVSARANMIEMENEVSRLEQELKVKDETFGQQIVELKTEVISVTNEKNQIQDTLEQTMNNSVILQRELDGRQEKLETLASRMEDFKKDKSEKESKLRKEAEEMIMSAREEMEQFRNLYEDTRKEMQTTHDRITVLEQAKQSLEKELQETLEQLESSQEEIITLTDRIQANTEAERDLQAHIEREKTHLSKHQEEIQKASEMNKKIRQTVQQKEAEIKELKAAKNKFQREVGLEKKVFIFVIGAESFTEKNQWILIELYTCFTFSK